jgi:hypothetical protein
MALAAGMTTSSHFEALLIKKIREEEMKFPHLTDGQPAWLYTRKGFGRGGRNLSTSNFAKELKDWHAILLREILQNGLDAKTGAGPVTVAIKQVILGEDGKKFLNRMLPSEHMARLAASMPYVNIPDEDFSSVLVFEDFGTSGLTGSLDDPDKDGSGENWNGFWFREGEGGKENSSGNGGAGQGKITYFSTSKVRTLFAHTVRATDGASLVYGASSFMRDYHFEDGKYNRDAYWGITKPHEVLREISVAVAESQLVGNFRKAFELERTGQQFGLSVVMPCPRGFDPEVAIRVSIAEFYAPIVRGDLIVRIGAIQIDKDSIDEIAEQKLSDEQAILLRTCMTKDYRAFMKEALEVSKSGPEVQVKVNGSISTLGESHFDKDIFAALAEKLKSGKQIAVRFAYVVKPKRKPPEECHFDVHLAYPELLQRAEEAVLRKNLLIGDEPFGGGGLRQRAQALTLIESDSLSRLLLCAEEPTHLKWNTRLDRLREYYSDGPEAVSFVRNAAARLLEVLTGGDTARDFRILAKYFSAPGLLAAAKSTGNKRGKKINIQPKVKVPKATAKVLQVQTLADGCVVKPTSANGISPDLLPISGELVFAYADVDGDPFEAYDPFDFQLSEHSFKIKSSGCAVTEKGDNALKFSITDVNFTLQIQGFQDNYRLAIRLDYKEKANAQAINIE